MDLLILLALISLNGVFALSELAIVSSRKNRLQMRVDKGDKGAKVALKLQEDPSAFLSTVQVGITLVGIIMGAYGATALAEDVAPWIVSTFPGLEKQAGFIAFGVVIAVTTYLSIVVGELVPKRIAITAPEAFASVIAPPMALLARIVFPVVFILRGSTNLILGLFGLSKVNADLMTEEEIESVIEEGAASGAIDEDERAMIRSVMRLADRDVRSIMTPRKDVVWLDLDDSPEELLKKIADSGHSRFPVARDDLEHVISVVQTKDLLTLSEGKRLPDFETAGHEPLFVPDSMTVLNLLEKMQASAVQMALVSDELGHIEGIVTAADVLGAIAGDVAFSPEDGLARPQKREDGSWLLDGRMAIEDAEIALGLDLTPEEDPPYTTVAGLVIHNLQRIPELGDVVISSGWRFEVIDMDGRRVDKLLVARLPSKEEDPTG
ncbi:hemolysin family protein [Hyphomonas sp.]|jgi:putative hemolysin|uniref:hemolysin family protein n=1 Tax=Hyphomonas sp. TaxID=87 RepID=UPI0025C1889E|nr:hemolysin family protein [Hyphomonas sp.]